MRSYHSYRSYTKRGDRHTSRTQSYMLALLLSCYNTSTYGYHWSYSRRFSSPRSTKLLSRCIFTGGTTTGGGYIVGGGGGGGGGVGGGGGGGGATVVVAAAGAAGAAVVVVVVVVVLLLLCPSMITHRKTPDAHSLTAHRSLCTMFTQDDVLIVQVF